jgi:hypothetical protein
MKDLNMKEISTFSRRKYNRVSSQPQGRQRFLKQDIKGINYENKDRVFVNQKTIYRQ